MSVIRRAGVLAAAAILALLAGCASNGVPGVRGEGITIPSAGVIVDYQLGGAYEPANGVGGVVRDSTDPAGVGLYSICYVNGFQTQPSERQEWLDERTDLVLRDDDGTPVIDPGWPDELILDTSTAANRAAIAAYYEPVIAGCADSGFDAVEIDNLDSYTRSGGALSADDAVELAGGYADLAHRSGLAIGQKNAAELGTRGRDEAGFDFAVAEECFAFSECARYTEVYGSAVIDIEYGDSEAFEDACADPDRAPSTVLRDRELTTPGEPGYVFAACPRVGG